MSLTNDIYLPRSKSISWCIYKVSKFGGTIATSRHDFTGNGGLDLGKLRLKNRNVS